MLVEKLMAGSLLICIVCFALAGLGWLDNYLVKREQRKKGGEDE